MKRLIILVALLAAGVLSIATAGYQQPSLGLPTAALAATQIEKVKDSHPRQDQDRHHKNDRYKAAIQAIYDDLKVVAPN